MTLVGLMRNMEGGRTPYQALLDVQYSARYHHIAERWFAGLRKLANFLNLFFGSAAAVSALNQYSTMAAITATVIVAISILDNVYDSSGKIALHRNLYQRFLDLEAKIHRNGLDVSAIDAAIAEIEKDEPPIIERLRRIAYNANLQTAGHRGELLTLSWVDRQLAHWL